MTGPQGTGLDLFQDLVMGTEQFRIVEQICGFFFFNHHTISLAAATIYRMCQQPRFFLLQVIC